jgi:rhomboid-like protein
MDILPSLGASGAIYAAVTMTALGFPDSEVSLLFLPMVAVPAQWGVGALVLLDITGILRGWRLVHCIIVFLTCFPYLVTQGI